MTLPAITHYFYSPGSGTDTAGQQTAGWDPPSGVTVGTAPAGLVFYGLLFGTMTSVTPVDDWTPVATGSVGGSNFYLFRRDTGASEPSTYEFGFDPPIALDSETPVIVGFGVSDVAGEVVGTPQFDIGDTATSDTLTVPAGNVLSVHVWGGAQLPPLGAPAWVPDTTDFPSNRRFGYGLSGHPYTATIGEIRNAATAPGHPATLPVPGSDNFGIQFLFSDIPIALGGGWGVGMVRMGGN